jgi:hypothetical protein
VQEAEGGSVEKLSLKVFSADARQASAHRTSFGDGAAALQFSAVLPVIK